MKPLSFKSRIRLALCFGAVVATTFTLWPRARSSAYYFELTMRSALSGFAELHYDIRSGENESLSGRLPVEGGNREVDYKFRLPEGKYSRLRFDVIDRPGNAMVLSKLRITQGESLLVRAIAPVQVKALRQIDQLESGPTSVSLVTASSADSPSVTVDLGSEPLSLKSFAKGSRRTYARRFLLSIIPASVLGLLAAPLLQLLRARLGALRWWARIRSWAESHPQQAVLVAAFFFVSLSCYPVILFGKSFVSPNNHSHTYLLYGEMPTVPGYKDVATDDEKGSDLGAIMWQNWPYSVVEARALFKYGELPLWNRYNSTGLPLLGQGLSMCADPLQLVVLAAGGASAAWDLKYLLAKFLFTGCVGLCVLQAVRHLPAALLIAATAPFIGFFSFRYSHPAYFSLCYAPAVLLCWFKLIDSRPGKATAVWLGAMVLADWTLINGGGLKESYILFLAMNLCGLLTLLLGHSIVGGKTTKLFQVFLVKVIFVAIAMPVWLTFFHALRNSSTIYDAGGVWQIIPALFIGLFDDIFYRQFNPAENHLDPALNFLILLALLWLLCSSRRANPRNLGRGLILTSLVALVFVFGIVPANWIMRVPLLKNILHIDNTFSCVAIVCLLVLAGFGLKTFWIDSQAADFKGTYLRVMVVLFAMIAFYLGLTEADMHSNIPMREMGERIPKSPFFWGYGLSLLLAVSLAPWLGRFALRLKRGRPILSFSLILLFVLIHWRHGMHLSTPFDAYVMNPQRRINLMDESSPALQLVKTRAAGPSRAAGLDEALFPGYGGAVEIEQIDSPDPLLNKHYQALLTLSGARVIFGGSRAGRVDEQLASEPLLFNMLNVRFYLGFADPKAAFAPSLKKIASLDLDVYESEHVWPRAFFTDGFVAYDQETDFVQLLQTSDGAPFAAVPREEMGTHKELSQLAGGSALSAARLVIAARDYRFTNNSTSFTVTAARPGVVVLTEAFVSGDFHVLVNGQPADYFRVNSAFRGVAVPGPGDYRISFTYWPRYFTLSLFMAGAGVAILLTWLTIMSRAGIRRSPVS